MLISAVPLELARATTKSPANGTKMRTAALMIFPGRILGCYKFKVIVTFHFQIFLKVVIFQVSSCDVNLIQYSFTVTEAASSSLAWQYIIQAFLCLGKSFCQVCLTKISLTHFSVQVWGSEIFPLSERQGSGARM